MLFANQRMFDYENKVSKQLAHVLSNTVPVKVGSALRSPDGGLIKDIRGKLEVFASYYQDLYAPQEVQQGYWDPFFASFELPSITLEQVSLLELPISGDEIANRLFKGK